MKLQSRRLHGLDTLRSLAILSVIVFHIWGYGGDGKLPAWLEPAARCGWIGVDLFFVLSGFLIGSQLLRPYAAGERPGLWEFYRNRMYRILPAYLVVLGLYEFVPRWPENPSLAPAWSFLTFTLNFVIGHANAYGFSHAWSLCVEEHFYLLLPLIVLAVMRKPSLRRAVIVFAALTVLGMAARAFVLMHWLRPMAARDEEISGHYLNLIYYATYCHFDGLAAGVALAATRTFRPGWWEWIARRGHALTIGAVALVGATVPITWQRYVSAEGITAVGDVVAFPMLSLGLGMLVASAMSENGVLSRVRVPGAKLVATLAYSLYLTQKAMIHVTSDWFPRVEKWGGWRWLALYAVCCLVVAGALHLCVERPFLLMRDRKVRSGADLEASPHGKG